MYPRPPQFVCTAGAAVGTTPGAGVGPACRPGRLGSARLQPSQFTRLFASMLIESVPLSAPSTYAHDTVAGTTTSPVWSHASDVGLFRACWQVMAWTQIGWGWKGHRDRTRY